MTQTRFLECQDTLRESHRMLSTLLSNLPGMAYRCKNDPDWTMEFVSEGCLELTGYQPSELIGNRKTSYAKLIHPDDQEPVWGDVQAALKDRKPFRLIYRISTAQGHEKWVWEQGRGVFSSEGELVALEGFITDITDRKLAEEKVKKSEERYAKLFNSVSDGLGLVDENEIIQYCNPAYARIFEVDNPSEMVGRSILDFVPSEKRDLVRSETKKRRQNEHSTYELEIVTAKNNRRYILAAVSPQFDEKGRYLGAFGDLIDITERKRLENQLVQSQKMEAVGRLAGGVAHDFNNLLTILIGQSQLLQQQVKPADPLRHHIDLVRQTCDRAAALTRQLLAFSRRQPIQAQVFDFNRTVSEMLKMLQRLVGDNIELIARLASEPQLIKTDENQMEQVLLNLVVNARDAMPQGGKITIETNSLLLDKTFVSQHRGAQEGPHVVLTVSDTGTGMDAETLSHLFEPFFTTKEQGKGTGLGLSTTYGIIKQSKGSIWVYSEPGEGTTFKIYLPRVLQGTENVSIAQNKPESQQGWETVLVVEQENNIRSLIRTILQVNGYKVLQATDADEAIETCQTHSGPIHLLLTDVVMPRMNGPQLAEQIRKMCSEIRVLYMSGYTGDAIATLGVLDVDMPLLQKPFTIESLTQKVREVLDQPKANVKQVERTVS